MTQARDYLGEDDLRFAAESWRTIFEDYDDDNDDEANKEPAKTSRSILLEGEFLNWPLWKKKAEVKLASGPLTALARDDRGRTVCGYIHWSKGWTGLVEVEGFENGNVEVASIVSPEVFDNIVTILAGGYVDHLVARLRMSAGVPKDWDGRDPLLVNSIGLTCQAQGYGLAGIRPKK